MFTYEQWTKCHSHRNIDQRDKNPPRDYKENNESVKS